MEIAFVWCLVLALILSIANLIYCIVVWMGASKKNKRGTRYANSGAFKEQESLAAKEVIKAFGLVVLSFTGPLFLLGLVVYGLILFGKALNNSLKNNQS